MTAALAERAPFGSDGGPSVVYDAVAVLPSQDNVSDLLHEAPAQEFVSSST